MVFGVVVLAGGAGLFAYRYLARPVTLTVAAGSIDGEAAALMSIISTRLASTNARVRLKVVDTGTATAASKAFAAGNADLAIVRADIGDLSAARTVVLLTHTVVLILAPPGSTIKDMDGLKGRTVGVVGAEANHRVIELLTQEYDLARAKVQFRDLAPADVPKAFQSRQIHALLVVTPISQKYLTMVRNLFDRNTKQQPGLIAIESAGAIAAVAAAYESYELPKGTLRGSPALPDDDLTTLRLPFYLVANKKLDDDVVGDLAKAVMNTRHDLIAAHPLLAQVAAPSTDKDAFIPIHPGAAAYFDGDEKSFFDKYGDRLFYGSMLLGTLTSVFAAGWKFMQRNEEAESPLNVLYALASRIRHAGDEAELGAVEEEMDNILKAELVKYARGESNASDASALGLAVHRLEHLINQRRGTLQKLAPTA
jgi:TRAP-type uncharacterized transport system substrate-binding protein